MNLLEKVLSWMRGPNDPESAAEAQRLREERETVRTSQLAGPANVPPTPNVLDPGDDR